jgi:nucleotide-binding universal stress UspA family protein
VFKTIVIGLDGSESASAAIPAAVELARLSGGSIVVAHVDERIAAKGDMPSLRADEDEVKAAISKQADAITADGVDARLETASVVLGGPAHSIEDIAEAAGADVIVVGSKGRSGISGLLLGSVPDRLLHIAKRPVLVIPAAK